MTDRLVAQAAHAGSLVQTLCVNWDGRRVKAIEIRRVTTSRRAWVYRVVALSPYDPGFRVVIGDLASLEEAADTAEALLADLLGISS